MLGQQISCLGKGRLTVDEILVLLFSFLSFPSHLLTRHATPSIQKTLGNYISSTSSWETEACLLCDLCWHNTKHTYLIIKYLLHL